MHFKHPELLYALFLLVIPVLVHLFELRRFQTEYFTNVRFLRELTSQTRKSSSIKKWLLLATRLLLLTVLILAFAQPYFDTKTNKLAEREVVIVLDNSFSMQAQGNKGELFKRAVQDIITQVPPTKNISVLTPDNEFWQTDIATIKTDLLNLNYTNQRFSAKDLLQKIAQHNSYLPKDVVIITDGKGSKPSDFSQLPENIQTHLVLPEAVKQSNVSVDSVFVFQTLENFYELKIKLSCYGELVKQIPLAVYNKTEGVAKMMVSFTKPTEEIKITIPKNTFHGKVSIQDAGLAFDNDYFFSISAPKKTSVWSIGDTDKATFLSRIFTEDEFVYKNVSLSEINYNDIQNQNVIVLNEIKQLTVSLQKNLQSFAEKGGAIIAIPPVDMDVVSYNTWLRAFGNFQFGTLKNNKRLVSKINFEHPVYKAVFEKKVTNFDYPSVNTSFETSGTANSVLFFDDNTPFLISSEKGFGKLYVFTSSLEKNNSNFKLSPLIVPTFYNMAQITNEAELAHTVGENESKYVSVSLQKNEMIRLVNGMQEYIPIQQISDKKVKVSFFDYPQQAGNFELKNNDALIENISFNYNRTESDVTKPSPALETDEIILDDIETIFDTVLTTQKDNDVWRWLLGLTLLFLVAELFIQKFLK